MQEREQKAMSDSQRALELQQLAAGSVSPLDASQLSAAAQRCSSKAEEAAQIAALARAEAARMSGHSPALGAAAGNPALEVSAERPAPGALAESSASGPSAERPALGASAESPAPMPMAMAASLESAVPNSGAELVTDSLLAAEGDSIAADIALQNRLNAQTDASPAEQTQLSSSSADVVRGLSSEMQAAMQQLVASARLSSTTAMPGPGSETATPSWAGTHAWGTGAATEYGRGQGLPDMSSPTLAASSSYQTPDLPNQASRQVPDLASPLRLAVAAEIPALPEQVSEGDAEEQGLSGMQIHLMHQLEGLERSVRRVEQQVSFTKQTRRRLKSASSLPQVTLPPFFHS